MNKTYKLPEHPKAKCFCLENEHTIYLMIGSKTYIATYHKASGLATLEKCRSLVFNRHCMWFLEYIQQRYKEDFVKSLIYMPYKQGR